MPNRWAARGKNKTRRCKGEQAQDRTTGVHQYTKRALCSSEKSKKRRIDMLIWTGGEGKVIRQSKTQAPEKTPQKTGERKLRQKGRTRSCKKIWGEGSVFNHSREVENERGDWKNLSKERSFPASEEKVNASM